MIRRPSYISSRKTGKRTAIFYEVFANESDFDAHNAKPDVQAWFAKLPELAEGGVHAMKMKILTAPKE